MDLSVVVMTYDELYSLKPTVEEIHQRLQTLGCTFEVLIINDGSRDGSGDLAERLAAELSHVRVIHHAQNQGLGGVYRSGFRGALGDCVTFFPADGQVPSVMLERIFPLMASWDLVLCYVPSDLRLVGRVLSFFERLIYRLLFGKLPRYQGIMMFRRQILEEMTLEMSGRGWAIVWEFIIRTRGLGKRIISVPAVMRPRNAGVSKVQNWRSIFANLSQLLQLFWVLHRPGRRRPRSC
jgi:glycosyltransferase involved in cell wall biosynthesis